MSRRSSLFYSYFAVIEKCDPFLVLAFITPFTIYMATLAPSVTFFDSGEFLTASYSLGSAHSPGYPLFLMYAKLFTWLPIGNIAFKINMATAFSSSLACLSVYLLVLRLLKKENSLTADAGFASFALKSAALSAALVFAFTPRLWLQSNHDKPYPLLAFITAVIYLLLLKWRDEYQEGRDRPPFIYTALFFSGLSMALHQSIVLLSLSWIVFILMTDWRIVYRIKEIILSLAFFLFGFSVHLYLPLRATQNPALNWGDPKTLNLFLWHFLRKGYPPEPHIRDMTLLWEQLKAFNVLNEFTFVGVLLLCFGLLKIWQKQKDVVVAYFAAIFLFLLVIVGYFNTPADTIFLTKEFFTPLYLFTAALIGVGLYHLLAYAVSNTTLPKRFGAVVYTVVLAMYFALPISLSINNYYENDQHNNYIAYDYATNSLRSLPQNSIMFTWGDSGAFPLWYLQVVERMREDVDLPHTPHLVFDWYQRSLPNVFKNSVIGHGNIQNFDSVNAMFLLVSENIHKRPVYLDLSARYSVDFSEYAPVQKGLVYRIRPVNIPAGLPDVSLWEDYTLRGIFEKISFLDLDTDKAIIIYANSYAEGGDFMLSIGRFEEGLHMLTMAEKIAPSTKVKVEQILARYGLQR